MSHVAAAPPLSRAGRFMAPRTAARQASLCVTVSQSLLRIMAIQSVMLSDHPILNILYSTMLNFKINSGFFFLKKKKKKKKKILFKLIQYYL